MSSIKDVMPATVEHAPGDGVPRHLTVVGIGASAGGLGALKQFFSQVPTDSGVAWVAVMHLSPTHESHLSELLQPHVGIPVRQVTETTVLEPDQIYVIPPNANLNAIDTHLRLSELEAAPAQRGAVDHFFRTLARTHHGRSVGVILTGTGADGAQGIREIKAKGGITLVQDPEEAEFDGMPRSAIATGEVDAVLPVEDIPGAVLRFINSDPRVPLEDESTGDGNHRRRVQKVFSVIRARTGRDFSRYKRPTVLRRVVRRMQLRQVEELDAYLEVLRTDPAEVDALSDDLLITVTSFFRDAEVFDVLARQVVPQLFKGKGPEDCIRVWSVGCATGEEAYSLAILLAEEAARHSAPPRIQIFATDLHQPSLARARHAHYTGDMEADVSAERLQQFFHAEKGGYRVREQVRELVLFSHHDVLGDPPFSKLDLIACRNVMIYFERDVQRDVLALFHYSLSADGFLVLGTSETVDEPKRFRAEDKEHRIYQRRAVTGAEARIPAFPLTRTRHPVSVETELPRRASAPGALHERMVERYAPPSLLVGEDDAVIHLSEHAGRYLVQPGGEPTVNVLKIIRAELRKELRDTLRTARQRGGAVVESNPVAMPLDGDIRSVVLHVRPSEGYVLIIFQERAASELHGSAHPEVGGGNAAREAGRLGELEADLALAGQRLQTTIEEYETTQNELRASNQELESLNEELRATMEELETSKEELQSINEELQALNEENRHRVEELGQLSGDLQNLLVATDIAILFLDRQLRIVRFTPKLAELFNVRPADQGRPIADFTHRLGYKDFMDDARTVLGRLTAVEREVQDESGRWYLTRVLPYRTPDDRIDGVVVNFIDVSDRKRLEEEVRHARIFAENIVETIRDPLLVLTADSRVIMANPAYYEHFRVHPEDTIDQRLYEIGNKQWDIPELRELLEEVLPENKVFNDFEIARDFERIGRRVMLINARRIDHVQLVLLGIHDITERKADELALHAAKEAAERANRDKGQFLSTISHEIRSPLNAATGYAQLMESSLAGPVTAEQKEYLARVRKCVSNVVAIIEEVLTFARSEAGGETLMLREADLAEVVRDVVAMAASSPTAPSLALQLSGAEDAVVATTDALKVRLILTNLVDNAIKYAAGPVEVALEANQQWVECHVRDRGPGIPPDQLERIFEPFVRLDSPTNRLQGGTGLGLAISRRFARLLGGDVTVESVVTQGAAFKLRLPRQSSDPNTEVGQVQLQ